MQEALAGITVTNATTKESIQNAIDTALANAGIADVIVKVEDFNKADATTDAAGSISGSISVTSKNDSSVKDDVTISKTIAKLPISDAEKVAAAKKTVQDVLAGITATNETTKEDIQNAIDTALANAGITDVIVKVEDFNKADATTDAAGSISGSISVTSKNDSSVKDDVTISKTIAKLPISDAEKVEAAKKVVQEALAGITVTNATTKESIQNAIDTALANAGIADVIVKVEDFNKADATTDAAGSISGSISVTSKNDSSVKDSTAINKTIPAIGESHTHQYVEWRYDAKEHWRVCSCGEKSVKSKHRYDNNKDAVCNDCGYKRTIKKPDNDKSDYTGSETPKPTETQPPTEPSQTTNPSAVPPVKAPQPTLGAGNTLDKQAEVQKAPQPGRAQGQSAGQGDKTVAKQGGADAAKTGTGQQSEGQTAQTSITQQSESGIAQPENGTAQADATQQPEGGAVQTIPATADSGRIAVSGGPVKTGNLTEDLETATKFEVGKGAVTVRVVCDDGKCAAGVNDTAAVANTVLTPEQIQLVNDGENIEVRIDIKDITGTVAGQDKEVIESSLGVYREELPQLTLGMYVDISMFVRVGESDWDAVTSTEEPIEVVIGIPEEFRENGREFYIIRAHEGEYALLADMDDDPETITVSTDRFSAYALAYRQADGSGESGRCGLCHICPTFLGICYFIWLAIIASVVMIGIIALRKKKS